MTSLSENMSLEGVYSSKSSYAIINFRGVQPVFLPAVWNVEYKFFFGCYPKTKL
jgi:hypothetical protein